MKKKTAYVVEGKVILVPTEDKPHQALERLMGMLWHATSPDSTKVYIHQDTASAFMLGNRDAQPCPRMTDWRSEVPKDVTTAYVTGMKLGRLNIYEEPKIARHERADAKSEFEPKSLHTLSQLIKEHGGDLGRSDKSPIVQIQDADHIHLCVHEDHLEEMAAYAEILAAREGAKAYEDLKNMLQEAVTSRQSEADRKSSKGAMERLLDMLKGHEGPELPRRVA